MNKALIMTIIGPDAPGLVKAVSSTIAQHGGNWHQSHMSHLGDQFAGILRVDCPEENIATLTNDLQALAANGLKIDIIQEHESNEKSSRLLELDLIANDRLGIVNELSSAIADADCNIEELDTELEHSPWSGDLLFHATGLISLNSEASRSLLQEKLEDLGLDIQVTLTDTISPSQ